MTEDEKDEKKYLAELFNKGRFDILSLDELRDIKIVWDRGISRLLS